MLLNKRTKKDIDKNSTVFQARISVPLLQEFNAERIARGLSRTGALKIAIRLFLNVKLGDN